MNKKLKKKILASIIAGCTFSTIGLNGIVVAAAEDAIATTNKENMSSVFDKDETPNASGYVFGRVNITGGGYIPSVIFNKSEKDLAYMRTDMGGAYRWDSGKKKWIQLLDKFNADDWNFTGPESIATDSSDPNRLYIAVGTYTTDWATNGCILRSTDRGKTFEKTDLPFKLGSNMPGRNMGERLNVDPNDNSVLYFGTRSGNGLWKSTDYGVTWSKVESFTATGDFSDEWSKDPLGVVWEIFDPTSSEKGQPCQTIYVGVANKGKEDTIYCSKDGGNTWNPVQGQPKYDWEVTEKRPGNLIPGRAALGSNGMLYISYTNQTGPYDGNHGGVWKYDTKTGGWTDITPVKNTDDIYWGYGGMTVDSSNPNIIMVSMLNSYWPDSNIYRSVDGGKTWKAFWKQDYSDKIQRLNSYELDYSAAPWLDWGKTSEYPEVSPKLGWMIGDVEIDPFDSNHVVYGTGATLYGITNATNLENGKKVHVEVQAQGVEENAVLDLASPPSGDAQLISGTGDIGGFVHTDITKSPKMITNPTISNCSSVDYAELNPNIMVRAGDVGVVGVSKDNGKSWTKAKGQIPAGSGGGDYLTTGGNIALSADGKSIVYSPNGDGAAVVYSDNYGDKWNVSAGIPSKAKVVSDRVNPKKFYAFSGSEFYVSNDGGITFEKTGVNTLAEARDMNAVPGVEGDIWVAAGKNGMWHSIDGGKTFEKLSNIEISYVVGFGKAAPGKKNMSIYTHSKINGVSGIYRSDDSGENWVRVNDDNHQYGSADTSITGDPRIYGRFYLATNGMGIVVGEPKNK